MSHIIDVIIPTYKPDKSFISLIDKLENQTIKPNKIILMNTEEKFIKEFLEETQVLNKYDNIEIHHVSEKEYDHGKTRDMGVQFSKAPYFLCMTQDAVPYDEFLIEELLKVLQKENIASVYGKQLARENCHILENFTRKFNYPDESRIKSKADLQELGIKTYFCSNVCAAYKRDVYDKLGGFIKKTIFNEDMIYAAAVIKAGYEIGYVAQAQVIHSHHYTGKQQFHRNFDLGVSQADHPEVFKAVPSEKEGGKLVSSTVKFLIREKHLEQLIPFVYQCGCKYIGYRLGKAYKKLPKRLVETFSMNQNYWKE
ncbi:MAG: glycosyltransferase family 2 protein [Lachnospiraceae bacterium]|nr:glycosyltransferase family 2 protein [Lachnospiraceae bacterium]